MGTRVGSGELRVGSAGVRVGSVRVFRYQHVGIGESIALGVLPNTNPQCDGFRVAVEYRLKLLTMTVFHQICRIYLDLSMFVKHFYNVYLKSRMIPRYMLWNVFNQSTRPYLAFSKGSEWRAEATSYTTQIRFSNTHICGRQPHCPT